MRHPLASVLAAVLLLAACGEGEDEGAGMMPGSNCLASGCHAGGGEAPRFTAAGTVFAGGTSSAGVAGATVTLSGNGQTAVLTTNGAGNFFTSVNLGSTIGVAVSGNGGTTDRGPHHGGACGSCHAPGSASAPDRVHVGACGSCH